MGNAANAAVQGKLKMKLPSVSINCSPFMESLKPRNFRIPFVAFAEDVDPNPIHTWMHQEHTDIIKMVDTSANLHYNSWLPFAVVQNRNSAVLLEAVFDDYVVELLALSSPVLEQVVCGAVRCQRVVYTNDCGSVLISHEESTDWVKLLNENLRSCPFLLLFVEARMSGHSHGSISADTVVTQEVHRTVFTLETDKNNVTTMLHYDSFGGALEGRINPFVGRRFYKSIRPLVESQLVFGCLHTDAHAGMQKWLRGGKRIRDPSSYLDNGCSQLYTVFWAYNVLQLRKRVGRPLKEWGMCVERYYIEAYKTRPEDLYDLVLKLGYHLCKRKERLFNRQVSHRLRMGSYRGIRYPITAKVNKLLRFSSNNDMEQLRDNLDDAMYFQRQTSILRKHPP